MLEQLFGSRTRLKLLRLFLTNPQTPFYVRELTRKINEQLNSVRRELANLTTLGMVLPTDYEDKKYYRLNPSFVLNEELRAVLLKSQVLVEQDLIRRLKGTGKIKYMVLTGQFTGAKQPVTDILIVGKIDKAQVIKAIERFQRELNRELNYTVLSPREYKERREFGDKFLLTVLNNPKVVVIDDTAELE